MRKTALIFDESIGLVGGEGNIGEGERLGEDVSNCLEESSGDFANAFHDRRPCWSCTTLRLLGFLVTNQTTSDLLASNGYIDMSARYCSPSLTNDADADAEIILFWIWKVLTNKE